MPNVTPVVIAVLLAELVHTCVDWSWWF